MPAPSLDRTQEIYLEIPGILKRGGKNAPVWGGRGRKGGLGI